MPGANPLRYRKSQCSKRALGGRTGVRDVTDQQKSRPSDARALRSRASLRTALLKLLEEKTFDRISIKEITITAGVSYPTFFRNYGSKADLLSDIATDEILQLMTIMRSYADRAEIQGNANAICEYVGARRPLWTVLLNTGAASVMREEFAKAAKESVKTSGQINPGLPLDMATAIVAGGLLEILGWWLRQPADYPIGRVAAFLRLLVLEPTVTPHDLDD